MISSKHNFTGNEVKLQKEFLVKAVETFRLSKQTNSKSLLQQFGSVSFYFLVCIFNNYQSNAQSQDSTFSFPSSFLSFVLRFWGIDQRIQVGTYLISSRMGVSFGVRLLGLRRPDVLLRIRLGLQFRDGLDLGSSLAEVAREEGNRDYSTQQN